MESFTDHYGFLTEGFCLFKQIPGVASIGQEEASKWTLSVLHLKFAVDLLAGVTCLLVDIDLENDNEAGSEFRENF